MNIRIALGLTAAAVTMTACGDGLEYVSFADGTSTAVSALTGQSLDSSAHTTSQLSGELDRAANTFELGSLDGSIDLARTTVTLTGGGVVDLTGTADFARFYVAQPTVGNQTRGVVGVSTVTYNVPVTGTASYTGASQVRIQDGLNFYELQGTVAATADFAAGTLDVTLDDLDGTQTFIGVTNVTDVATITIADAVISGNTASGGTSTLVSATINGGAGFSGTQTTLHEAGFYGPYADEVGGVLDIVDTATFTVSGEYIGD
ncbi:Transferrin binding protein-like solute binding protein [Monaibacterium marinum]|uniref:Transferrin binding protein-like solute binding protein n=1 Tax=Pontivivens marinum TaxID=1690039 RepID=A0A2C9CQZ2_9RHOB|nr:transferrin-binding protein-like solute binding protein [Monaibacterium marinum]SOH93971.1 Transferrin binding protein-like solute binding protein [Monaibacterium marinum]